MMYVTRILLCLLAVTSILALCRASPVSTSVLERPDFEDEYKAAGIALNDTLNSVCICDSACDVALKNRKSERDLLYSTAELRSSGNRCALIARYQNFDFCASH